MPVWQSVIAVAMSFLLALVALSRDGRDRYDACRRDGQSHPARLQRAKPGQRQRQLDEANITAGAATSVADLLTQSSGRSGPRIRAHQVAEILFSD
jgi:hypothetical protein